MLLTKTVKLDWPEVSVGKKGACQQAGGPELDSPGLTQEMERTEPHKLSPDGHMHSDLCTLLYPQNK